MKLKFLAVIAALSLSACDSQSGEYKNIGEMAAAGVLPSQRMAERMGGWDEIAADVKARQRMRPASEIIPMQDSGGANNAGSRPIITCYSIGSITTCY